MGMSSGEGVAPPTSTRDILASVVNAEKFFWAGLELGGSRGEVQQVREAALSLGLLRAFQTALGKGGKNNAIIAAALLGECCSIAFPSLLTDPSSRRCFRGCDPSTRNARVH